MTPARAARQAGLTYVTDSVRGIKRVRSSAGDFRYVGANGRKITAKATLARIKSLAVPPAWEEVWICPNGRGHLQATDVMRAGASSTAIIRAFAKSATLASSIN